LIRQAVFVAPERLDIVDFAPPELEPGDVRIAVDICGVCGSDIASYRHGHYVSAGQVMGHEVTGRVVETGGDVRHLEPGQRVVVRPMRSCGNCWYCESGLPHLCGRTGELSVGYGADGAFADQLVVVDARTTGQVVPIDRDAADAVWAEPVAVAVHAAGRASAEAGDRALVIGSGPIGLCLVAVCIALGVEVEFAELRPSRRAAARRLGASTWSGGEVDVIFDASGSPAAIGEALPSLVPGGRLVVVALGERSLPLEAAAVEVRGSYAFVPLDFQRAVSLIESGAVALGAAISHRLPLDETASAIRTAAEDPSAIKVVVEPVRTRETIEPPVS
jgi:2-desacetyl-2-hydroxyethyl bacteriochlorophyllide A dehydrogenase